MEDRIRSGASGRRVTGPSRTIRALALGALFTLLPIGIDAGETRGEHLSPETAIEMGNRAYLASLEHGDADAFASLFADDAVSLPPHGQPIRGRPAIQASIAAELQRVVFADGALHTVEIHIVRDMAVEVGTYSFTVRTDGYPSVLAGRYVTVWRYVGGAWKIAVDSSQPDAPTPSATDIPI
jgi:uncharacterized protein (TIGR02246 family)